MKWTHVGWLLAGLLTASASLRAADVTLTVNGKVVARPCTVSTVNATVELGDLYTFSLIGAGSASAWHSVALDLSNCPVGTSRVKPPSAERRTAPAITKTRERRAIFSSNCRTRTAPR